jgi:hypothetical protein
MIEFIDVFLIWSFKRIVLLSIDIFKLASFE